MPSHAGRERALNTDSGPRMPEYYDPYTSPSDRTPDELPEGLKEHTGDSDKEHTGDSDAAIFNASGLTIRIHKSDLKGVPLADTSKVAGVIKRLLLEQAAFLGSIVIPPARSQQIDESSQVIATNLQELWGNHAHTSR